MPPKPEDHKSSVDLVGPLDDWHSVAIIVESGAVEFFLDGRQLSHPDWRFVPREPMTINMNNWFDVLPTRDDGAPGT